VTHILVATWPLAESQLERIRAVSPRVVLDYAPDIGRAEISARLASDPSIEVLLTTALPDPWGLGGCLRWAQLCSAGVDLEQDNPLWHDPNVVVTTASGIHGPAMSQWALAMILHHALRLGQMLRFKETRRWEMRFDQELNGDVVIGRVLGLVGYGSIGRECARLGRGLGMRVLATRRSSPDQQYQSNRFVPAAVGQRAAFDDQVALVSLDRLMEESDYVVITAPLTAETHGLIGARQLASLRPTAFLINISRGAIVDEAALIDALRTGRLAGAALDAFGTEPLPADSPLFDLPNVVLSPHVSGNFRDYWDLVVEVFCTNLSRYLAGEPLLNVVDRQRGY
jgi:phosphoglycerate dehydrogenase-like enzyme